MRFAGVLLASAVFLTALVNSAMAQSSFTRDYALSESCRLTEEQRYADAVLMAERLRLSLPDDPVSHVTAGAVALQVGGVSFASSEFDTALKISPGYPLAVYGKALTDLQYGEAAAAFSLLDSIDKIPLSAAAANDIAVARAICLTDEGKAVDAVSALSAETDPSATEIVALLNFRRTHSDPSILKTLLDNSMVNGIPGVIEPPGLRLLLPESDVGPAIESSVTDADMSDDLVKRFDSTYIADGLRTVNGEVSLSLPRKAASGTYMVTLSVDNQQIGITDRPPYQFTWDSRSTDNGVHSCVFSMTNSYGNQVAIQEFDVYVLNATRNASENVGSLSDDQSDRIWNLMRLRPDYKVAEYELALAYSGAHDNDDYETYILRTAALDPDYRDTRSRIRPLFAGQVPDKFPVPDGTTLPSSLGLSTGKASAAGFWAGSAHVREIALTFDDGPLPQPTADLLNALKLANAHGTFFVVGMRAVESPNSLRQMAADGNAVEDHSYTHPNLAQILPEHVLPEILRTAVVIQAATGLWPHFLRPPGGNTNSLVLATAKVCGMSGAFWTIDALPAEEGGSPDAVAKWVINRARPGAIVLMHNGMAATVGAIPQLVQGLRQRGYKLVTIRQLAADALADRHPNT